MLFNKQNIILLCSILSFFIATGCSDPESTDDSAAAAATQLGLGGDTLSAPSQSLKVMTEGAQPGIWTSDYPAAQKLAQEQDLPILLFFNGTGNC